jgi:ABC-type transporter Mla maintaining outer membrane lipid asymmetry ATPase subunit MlaF
MMIINEGSAVVEGTFKELSTSKDEWVRSFFE